jgi:hypothetical protein
MSPEASQRRSRRARRSAGDALHHAPRVIPRPSRSSDSAVLIEQRAQRALRSGHRHLERRDGHRAAEGLRGEVEDGESVAHEELPTAVHVELVPDRREGRSVRAVREAPRSAPAGSNVGRDSEPDLAAGDRCARRFAPRAGRLPSAVHGKTADHHDLRRPAPSRASPGSQGRTPLCGRFQARSGRRCSRPASTARQAGGSTRRTSPRPRRIAPEAPLVEFRLGRVAVRDSNPESHGILEALTATRMGRALSRATIQDFSLRVSRKGNAGWGVAQG